MERVHRHCVDCLSSVENVWIFTWCLMDILSPTNSANVCHVWTLNSCYNEYSETRSCSLLIKRKSSILLNMRSFIKTLLSSSLGLNALLVFFGYVCVLNFFEILESDALYVHVLASTYLLGIFMGCILVRDSIIKYDDLNDAMIFSFSLVNVDSIRLYIGTSEHSLSRQRTRFN